MTKLIQKYIEYLRYEKNYSSHTEISYFNDLSQFVQFLADNNLPVELELVDADIARRWIVSLMESKLSARSVNRKLSSLKSFFRYLNRKGIIEVNKVTTVMGPKVPKVIPSFVSDLDMNNVLDDEIFIENDFESVRDKTILEMFYLTGMRRAELIGLKLVDVDLDALLVKVTGKRNKQRLIPISEATATMLDDYLVMRTDIENASNSFFVRATGQDMYPMLVHRVVAKGLQSVSTLSKTSPHVLRHTFATSMMNNGADINAIKELLGHASLAATEVYTHTSLEELKQIYNKAHPRA